MTGPARRGGRPECSRETNLRNLAKIGAPAATRTRDPRLRRPVIYPGELRALGAIDSEPVFVSGHATLMVDEEDRSAASVLTTPAS